MRANIMRVAAVLAVVIAISRASASTITWTNTAGGNWDTVTANWTNSAGDSTTFTDDGTVDVIFNKTTGGTIIISPDMSPLSTTVSASSGTYVFSGGPIDSGSMIKSGGGTLQLTTENTFPGGFTLNSGTVECADLTDVFGAGTITFNGGTWGGIVNSKGDHTNAVVINGSFIKSHNSGTTLRGPVTLTGSHTVTNTRTSLSFTGVIDDNGNGYGITLHNSRSDAFFSISGTNTYSGKTIITGNGYVRALLKNEGVACGFGAPTGANAIIDLYNGAVLQVSTGSDSDRTINIAGDGVGTNGIHLNGNATATIGGVTVTGTGAKTLTLVRNGNPGKLTVNGPIPDADDGSKVSIEVPFGWNRQDNFLDLKGTNTFSGSIKVGTYVAGFLRIGGAGSLGAGSYTNTISIASGCGFDYASSVTQELSGEISGGGYLKASGAGVVRLTAPSNLVGNVTLSNGGTLQIGPCTGNALLTVTNNINVPNAATCTLALDITGGTILVDVAATMVYAGTHTTYLKIIGGGQETPIVSYGGSLTAFDYVVYNGTTKTWAAAQVAGALGGTQLRVDGSDIYIDPLPSGGTIYFFQ